MAMTKEEQRAAAERVLEKFPMTEEEKARQRELEMEPEDYPKNRRCVCGEEFDKMDIEGYCRHAQTHQPTSAQWSEAHQKVQAGKERQKQQDRAQ